MNNQEKQEFIKGKIIDALFTCIESKKLDELTADEIAQEASVSKRTLYKYFASKKEMYLALVKEVFIDLSKKIYAELGNIVEDDPWYHMTCIGREYMKYCLDNPIRAKLLIGYDEMDYIKDYGNWVEDIQKYSNKFELMPFIEAYYKYHDIQPPASTASIALYLWAEAQGMAVLLMSKSKWIKEYYGLEIEKTIEEHLMLSKKILGEWE